MEDIFLTSGCLFKIVNKVTIGFTKPAKMLCFTKLLQLKLLLPALNLKSSHFETCEWVFWAPETTENPLGGIWKAT